MNLLVTNTRNAQAYAIIRALKPYANKIVVTMYGESRLAARLSHAANSRLVDKRYYVPSPVEDWRAGRINRENTEIEERYIQAVLRICEEEKLDTIFPSFDPHVYVFSKNKERFEKLGVVVPVPDYETVVTPLDKYHTIKAAEEVEFPCPKTYLPESEDDIKRIADELGFPLVVKPRFSSASRGLEMVMDLPSLVIKMRQARDADTVPMLQEYIPGREKRHFDILLDRKGELKALFCRRTERNLFRLQSSISTAEEAIGRHSCVAQAAKLVQKLRWWGGVTVQTKIDDRSGVPQLMEINPRLGVKLWIRTELGINEPLLCLKIANGEEIDLVSHRFAGTMLLDPIEDWMALGYKVVDLLAYTIRTQIHGKSPVDILNSPMSLSELKRSYMESYCSGRKKVFNPYFTYFFQDPAVSILWWLQFTKVMARAVGQLGR